MIPVLDHHARCAGSRHRKYGRRHCDECRSGLIPVRCRYWRCPLPVCISGLAGTAGGGGMKHKGYQSSRDYARRNTLVRQGRASWWMPLRTMSDALRVAGLV